eukprot:CAMPEP_0174843464 /NCGR_PEP_ID=MMETSP1114-20130205/10544_1 /TAXON_ID=312471 /ORGANISM="Neobodo designis, Strain CCAP 1951/1" /LENGTH=442 /DNA_ID=CAMNT_0016077689 /DNA_START=318 /DNA_END=1642 /DNA_ORIENTATION=+
MAHHIVVWVNGERFPLMDDRRFHLGAFFPEGATLFDLGYAPPRPVPMSAIDHGVTAAKLRPFARYSASPPRPGIPAVVIHGVPEGATPVQLGHFIDMCLEGNYVEECNFFPTTTNTRTGLSSRAYALFGHPMMAQTLVDNRQVEWADFGATLTFEFLDVPRPSYGRRRNRTEPQLADPSITLAAPAKLSGSLYQQQEVRVSPNVDGIPPIAYYLQLVEDDEPVLAKWCTEGTCDVPLKHAITFAEKATDHVVHIVFAIRSRKEVFGFGQFMGYKAHDDGETATIGVDWLQYGAGVKKPEVDSCVSADVSVDIKDGSLLRPDWAFDICAAVDRTLQRPSVRAAPPQPSQQPATAIAPPPPPPPPPSMQQASSTPPSRQGGGSGGPTPNPNAGAWHPPPQHHHHHHAHHQHHSHHHHHHHHAGYGGGGYGGGDPSGRNRGTPPP